MLRRVVLAHRQHLGHSFLRKVCRSVVNHLPSSSSQRKGTAALKQSIAQHASGVSSKMHIFGDGSTNESGSSPPSTPQEILAAIDAVMAAGASEDTLLLTIRPSPLLPLFTRAKEFQRLLEVVAASRGTQCSLLLLRVARRLGCPMKPNVYECLCYHLALKKQWRNVIRVVSMGQRHMGRCSSRMLNYRARALVEEQRYATLHNILNEFKQYNQKPSRRTFHIILSGHLRNHDLARAKDCLQVMEEAGFSADASTHALIATYYRSFGPDPQVQKRALESLPYLPPTRATVIVNSLIRVCLDTHDRDGALRLLSLFEQDTVKEIFEVNSVDKIVMENGISQMNMSKDIYQTLRPNAVTFALFITQQTTQSSLAGAIRTFEAMVAIGIPPTSGSVAALIHAHFAARRGDCAILLVAKMCDGEKTPLSMFQALTSTPSASKLSFDFSLVSPTVQVFNALLKGMLQTRGLNGFRAILRIMVMNGIKPNAKSLQILLAHLNRRENATPRMLLRTLRIVSSLGLRPTLRHMHIIVSSVLRRQKHLLYGSGWKTAAERISRKSANLPTTDPGCLISSSDSFDPMAGVRLPTHLCYRGLAEPILHSLSDRHVKADSASIALRIRHDAVSEANMVSAREVFRSLLVRGLHPNEYHFSALMEGYTSMGDVEAAIEVMRSAERVGTRPNVVMFTILIVGHARQGKPELSIRVFQQMVKAGIQPDIPSIDAISRSFFVVGEFTMARKVLITLWPHIQPFPAELRSASLKNLIHRFRSLPVDNYDRYRTTTKEQRRLLRWKLHSLIKSWKDSRASRQTPLQTPKYLV